MGDPAPGVGDELLGELGRSGGTRHQLHHRLNLLAPLLIRYPYHSSVAHQRMFQQYRLDFGGIDIDAARDNHVGGPVARVEPSLGVQVADVPDRDELADPARVRVLRVIVVFEYRAVRRAEIDAPGYAGGAVIAVDVEYLQLHSGPWLADRPRMGQPVAGVHHRTGDLRAAEVLAEDGPPPFDHLLLQAG